MVKMPYLSVILIRLGMKKSDFDLKDLICSYRALKFLSCDGESKLFSGCLLLANAAGHPHCLRSRSDLAVDLGEVGHGHYLFQYRQSFFKYSKEIVLFCFFQ